MTSKQKATKTRKIIIALFSLFFSVGISLLIRPHFESYIKSEIALNVFLLIFTTIGCVVLYQIIIRR